VSGPADPPKSPRFDKVIHERARLVILTFLASGRDGRAEFTELKDALDFTAGNLSVQLKNLEAAGYITIEKSFRKNKPLTEVELTDKGDAALREYLDEMERLIGSLKKGG
jgi:DNA-binding MarR family transcriptional regulator